MGLTMKEKQSITKETVQRYKKATKKDKGMILDEFIQLTGYNRKYGSYGLRVYGKRLRVRGNVYLESELKNLSEILYGVMTHSYLPSSGF